MRCWLCLKDVTALYRNRICWHCAKYPYVTIPIPSAAHAATSQHDASAGSPLPAAGKPEACRRASPAPHSRSSAALCPTGPDALSSSRIERDLAAGVA
jgi:hypothetical protein